MGLRSVCDISTALLGILKSHKSIGNSLYGSCETSSPVLYVVNDVRLVIMGCMCEWVDV